MRLTLTDIDRPWFTSPADDVIVLEGTTYGVYNIYWNKVRVGSVHLFNGLWHAYTADGVLIDHSNPRIGVDVFIAGVLVCDTYAATQEVTA